MAKLTSISHDLYYDTNTDSLYPSKEYLMHQMKLAHEQAMQMNRMAQEKLPAVKEPEKEVNKTLLLIGD